MNPLQLKKECIGKKWIEIREEKLEEAVDKERVEGRKEGREKGEKGKKF